MITLLLATGAVFGSALLGAVVQLERPGEVADDQYGHAMDGGHDVNGDGIGDHLVTAIFNDETASAAGKVYLYLGRGPASQPADLAFLGEAADDQFGTSAGMGGDINGDGFGDVAIGARFNDRAGTDHGAVFVFYGGPDPGQTGMDAVPDLVLTGEAKDDWFGNSVDITEDFNGNGFADLLVGAPYNDDTGNAGGKAYVYYGGTAPDDITDLVLFGDPQDDSHFGWAVSSAGDVNADGHGDLLVGSRLFGSGASRAVGRAYLYLGGASPDATPDLVLTGEAKDDWFGNTVSGIGDFNQDGFDDIAVGAPFWDDLSDILNPKSAAGKVYVFFGGPVGIMDDVADWTASGEGSDDQLSQAIASAGDVDGNGSADLLIGAPLFDDPDSSDGAARGKTYLYLGSIPGVQPAASPELVIIGGSMDDQSGNAVTGAGDGNEDGLAEFVAGAHFSDPGGTGSGAATLYFLDCLDLEMTGDDIQWAGCLEFDTFDIRRGTPAGLSAGDFGTCLASGLTGTTTTDPTMPGMGEVFTYLVSGKGTPSQPELPIGFEANAEGRPPQPPCP